MLDTPVVADNTPDVEWWQRWQARWLRWVVAVPRRPRLLPAPDVPLAANRAPKTAPGPVDTARQAGVSVIVIVLRSRRAFTDGYRAIGRAPLRRRLVGALISADQERAGRQRAMPRSAGRSSWAATRRWSLAVVASLFVGGAALAHLLSERIGRTVARIAGRWFADLLDLLGDWWDDLGPGGPALVLLGGLSLLALGLLFPTTVALAGGRLIFRHHHGAHPGRRWRRRDDDRTDSPSRVGRARRSR